MKESISPNGPEVKIVAAFDCAMQSMVEVFDKPTSLAQLAMAYGGATALFILAKQTGLLSGNLQEQAEMLLNQAAKQLNLPIVIN